MHSIGQIFWNISCMRTCVNKSGGGGESQGNGHCPTPNTYRSAFPEQHFRIDFRYSSVVIQDSFMWSKPTNHKTPLMAFLYLRLVYHCFANSTAGDLKTNKCHKFVCLPPLALPAIFLKNNKRHHSGHAPPGLCSAQAIPPLKRHAFKGTKWKCSWM